MEPHLPATSVGGNVTPLKHGFHLFLLEEEMGRPQGKNTLNNIKSNMVPPQISGLTIAIPKHSNAHEAEKMTLKINI